MMGTYLNPGNAGFAEAIKSDYVDKTGLIGLINNTIGTKNKLSCVSRPRRFGKSYAAQMLCAYYDRSCDSHDLFSSFQIENDHSYEDHLNQYHVISLDISGFISSAKKNKLPLADVPGVIDQTLLKETKKLYPELDKVTDLNECLLELVRKTDTQIVFVIDEWDSMIREAKDDDRAQEGYLNLLRGWFKNNNFTSEAIAAAYMTGILPVKKDGTQSAISDFIEYTVLEPAQFAEYFGFTEQEVKRICAEKSLDFSKMSSWYDGYTVGDQRSVYNPYSVMQAAGTGRYKSFWKKTSAAETLITYIDMDQEGLQDDIARLIAGESITVDTDTFQNDVETFSCKDDVLTLLVHLGYLTYEEVQDSYSEDDDSTAGMVRIPNEEVRSEFDKLLRRAKHSSLIELVRKSDQLLQDTIAGNSEAVAMAIQDVHETEYAPTFYNNEQSLRYTVKMAYISCVDQYDKVEELASGKGMADLVFLPRRSSRLPVLIIELKWDKSASGAIAQIRENNYPKALEKYGGKIVLVGVNYNAKTKEHTCEIAYHHKGA